LYVIIDIETTGGRKQSEKITEIAMYKHDGVRLVDEYQTLINPEKKIPYNITQITGITDEMVQHAPKFYEVARKIVEFTEGCIFVAHNSNFDYGFVRQEFKSLGFDYDRETLCTVKLSRKLLPGYPSYSLGKLCKQLGIRITARHRAAGDALATVKLFEILLEKNNGEIPRNWKALQKQYNTPLPLQKIEKIPTSTGVYYFHDAEGNVVYIGKSVNLQQRLRSHLNNYGTEKGVEMMQQIHDVSTEVTGSDLIAQLLESEEIKRNTPVFNTALRKKEFGYGIYLQQEDSFIRLEVRKRSTIASEPLLKYTSKEAAKSRLESAAEEYDLCRGIIGLEKCRKGCMHVGMDNCRGAAIGRESAENHNQRLEEWIGRYNFPHPNFVVLDRGRNDDEHSFVLVENQHYVGYGYLSTDETIYSPDQWKMFLSSNFTHRDQTAIVQRFINENPSKVKPI
jgi:DNA polymerase-3 subunit epsilon